MNEHLRERILRKLDTLSDERGYQVLDYVEYLESRYAERQTAVNAFTKLADVVEDGLRAGRVSATTIAETVGLMNKAAGVLNGALNATRTAANDIMNATAPRPTTSPTDASSTARETKAPGTGEEKL